MPYYAPILAKYLNEVREEKMKTIKPPAPKPEHLGVDGSFIDFTIILLSVFALGLAIGFIINAL